MSLEMGIAEDGVKQVDRAEKKAHSNSAHLSLGAEKMNAVCFLVKPGSRADFRSWWSAAWVRRYAKRNRRFQVPIERLISLRESFLCAEQHLTSDVHLLKTNKVSRRRFKTLATDADGGRRINAPAGDCRDLSRCKERIGS